MPAPVPPIRGPPYGSAWEWNVRGIAAPTRLARSSRSGRPFGSVALRGAGSAGASAQPPLGMAHRDPVHLERTEHRHDLGHRHAGSSSDVGDQPRAARAQRVDDAHHLGSRVRWRRPSVRWRRASPWTCIAVAGGPAAPGGHRPCAAGELGHLVGVDDAYGVELPQQPVTSGGGGTRHRARNRSERPAERRGVSGGVERAGAESGLEHHAWRRWPRRSTCCVAGTSISSARHRTAVPTRPHPSRRCGRATPRARADRTGPRHPRGTPP